MPPLSGSNLLASFSLIIATAKECCQERIGLKLSALELGMISKIPQDAAIFRTAAEPRLRTASGMVETTPRVAAYAELLAAFRTRAESTGSRPIIEAKSARSPREDAARAITSATTPDRA